MINITPKEIVAELDKYIVGQYKAKRAVAIALRNRYRRTLLPQDFQDEVKPKNILMIGSTGVGKTEIARRLAKLVNSPFVKVEATKFTEVGYVGRDVESMVRDLVETSIRIVKGEKIDKVYLKGESLAEERILDILIPQPKRKHSFKNPLEALFSDSKEEAENEEENNSIEVHQRLKESYRRKLRENLMEDTLIEIEVEDIKGSTVEMFSGLGSEELNINLQDVLGGIIPRQKKKRKIPIKEARKILAQEEAQKLIDMDEVISEAVKRAEQEGIIFIDEIDKIASSGYSAGPDVSREGVQRDILPIIEGSTIMTKYGPIKTDHILFIAAGAFHIAKVSDLIPEIQGRLPIRVELENLTKDDFKRILTEPQNAIIKQYKALLETEGIKLSFTDNAIDKLAETAFKLNEEAENIGARRLNTVIEKIVEEISFEAPSITNKDIIIDETYIETALKDILKNKDLSRYII